MVVVKYVEYPKQNPCDTNECEFMWYESDEF